MIASTCALSAPAAINAATTAPALVAPPRREGDPPRWSSSTAPTSPSPLRPPPSRTRSAFGTRRTLRVQYDLEGAVLLLLEDLVAVRGLAQRQMVRGVVLDAERVVVAGHQREDVVEPVAHVGLAHPHRDLLVEHLQQRHRADRAAVDAGERDRAAAAHERDR